MKSEDELLKDAVLYANQRAMLTPDGFKRPLLTGATTINVNLIKAQKYVDTMDIIISNLSDSLDKINTDGGYDNTVDGAMRLFHYFFDRGVESFYLEVITGKSADKVVFDLLEVGGYYELDLPDKIQLDINKIVGNVVIISTELYDFMQSDDYKNLSFKRWIRIYMLAAISLALHYAQEIDFEN
jgi:hypothetical protein